MKTTNQTTQRFPGAFRMIFYVAAVAAIGLLNCIIVKAGELEKENDLAARLKAAVKVQAEPEIELEDWMLDTAYFTIPDYLIVEKEEEAELEDLMLDPAYFVVEPLLTASNNN